MEQKVSRSEALIRSYTNAAFANTVFGISKDTAQLRELAKNHLPVEQRAAIIKEPVLDARKKRLLSNAPNNGVAGAVTVEAADETFARVTLKWNKASPVFMHDTFASTPEYVQQAIRDSGGDEKTGGVYVNGEVHVIRENHESAEALERTLLHEGPALAPYLPITGNHSVSVEAANFSRPQVGGVLALQHGSRYGNGAVVVTYYVFVHVEARTFSAMPVGQQLRVSAAAESDVLLSTVCDYLVINLASAHGTGAVGAFGCFDLLFHGDAPWLRIKQLGVAGSATPSAGNRLAVRRDPPRS